MNFTSQTSYCTFLIIIINAINLSFIIYILSLYVNKLPVYFATMSRILWGHYRAVNITQQYFELPKRNGFLLFNYKQFSDDYIGNNYTKNCFLW